MVVKTKRAATKTVAKSSAKQITKKLSPKDILELKNSEKRIISSLVNGSFKPSKTLSQKKAELVVENFPLAVHFAKKYYRPDYDIQDLVQVAAIGLIKAVKKFNDKMSTRLVHYAAPTIEGEIRHYLRDNFHSIRVSRKAVETNAKLQKYREEYLYANGEEISNKDLARVFKMSLKEVESVTSAVRTHYTISLDAPLGCVDKSQNGAKRYEDLMAGDNNIERMLEVETLNAGLSVLSKRDRQIIVDRFFRDFGQEEIARLHDVTQAQVSRIIRSACQKMKTVMA